MKDAYGTMPVGTVGICRCPMMLYMCQTWWSRRCEIKYVYVYIKHRAAVLRYNLSYRVVPVPWYLVCDGARGPQKTVLFGSGSTLIRSTKARDLVCSKNRCSKLPSCADCRAWTSKGASTSHFLSSHFVRTIGYCRPRFTQPRCVRTVQSIVRSKWPLSPRRRQRARRAPAPPAVT